MTGFKPKSPPNHLIQRSQVGDQEAFSEIFHDYKNLVYKTAFLLLGNNEDAEDILQSVFLLVYKSLSSYDSSKGAFTTWLHRITINQCLNFRRRQRFSALSLTNWVENTLVSPSRHEKQIEEEQIMEHALSNLSEKLRAVVVLRYYWEMTYAEIATTLEIPLGTVKSRLSQALDGLAETLYAPKNQKQKEVAK